MREQQAEQGSQHPRERRVEDEARLARVEGRAEGPVRVQVDLAELARGFHPTDHVKVEVVAAGAAVDSERMHGKERRQRMRRKWVNPGLRIETWGTRFCGGRIIAA